MICVMAIEEGCSALLLSGTMSICHCTKFNYLRPHA